VFLNPSGLTTGFLAPMMVPPLMLRSMSTTVQMGGGGTAWFDSLGVDHPKSHT
jgi:hypothetical protein